MESTPDSLPPPPHVSMKTIPMAGLLVDAYGLDELSTPQPATQITCLWLHHPRQKTRAHMADIAARAVGAWNERRGSGSCGAPGRGLVALAFDQRNHGSREVSKVANDSWRAGNERHAVDMMGAIRGMAEDTRGLMDVVEGYLGVGEVSGHFVLGVSLGGHSTWQMMFSDERVTAGVVIIGCPDYICLMTDRARRSKLDTYNPDDGGASFLGSRHFPRDLVALCRRADPKALLFGTDPVPKTSELGRGDRERLGRVLEERVGGKRFLVCSGADDKLVPYRASRQFMKFLTGAVEGWYKGKEVVLENTVYEGVGHEFSEGMVKDSVRFIVDALEEGPKEKPKM